MIERSGRGYDLEIEQRKARQGWAVLIWTVLGGARQVGAGQGRAKQGRAGQGRAGQGYQEGDFWRLLGRYTLDAHVVHAEFLSRPVLGFDGALFHFALLQTDV